MKLGFIGIGKFGGPVCRNLIKHHNVIVYARRPAERDKMVALGASGAETAKTLAAQADIVFTCLPGPAEVEEVVLGEEGIAEGARPGLIYVDLSTNSPTVIRKLAAELASRGISMLDAPLSGGVARAEAGTLSVIVGGEKDVVAKVEPFLRTFGENIFHVGDHGAGCVAKLVNNMLLFCNLAVANEGFMLGVQAGLDPDMLFQVVSTSSGASDAVNRRMQRKIFQGDFEPEGTLDTCHKDLRMALQLGEETGTPLLFGSLLVNLMRQSVALGHGDRDVGVLICHLEDTMGRKVRSAAASRQ